MKEPFTIADFRRGWMKVLEEEDQQKMMPIHPLASVRITQGSKVYCKFCHHGYTDGTMAGKTFRYSDLCHGKRRWWIFSWKCPRRPHFHVKCKLCDVSWFESMIEEEK